MTSNREITRAIRRALWMSTIAAAGMSSLAAHAQDQAQGQEQQQQGGATTQSLETVVVTGTRIVSPNLDAISPVTAISSEELAATGEVRVEDIINQLPQAFAAQGSNIANGADGTATVSLRGLGQERTLVLVNGRRMMPGDPDGGNAADLNFIPAALIRRVDILTGGASSVYGADAVAGVVNFIMDTDFQGVKLEAHYSWYQHENDNPVGRIVENRGFASPPGNVDVGYTRDITLALGFGGADQPGHALFYATYRDVDPVLQAAFDYSACTFNSSDPEDPTDRAFTCGGSGTSANAHFFTVNPATGAVVSDTVVEAGGALRPFDPTDQYNFGPLNYFQRPDERYTAGVYLNYDMAEAAEAYGELMFMDDRSVAQIAPSGSFFNTVEVNCDNPLLSAAQVQEFCGQFGLGPDDSGLALIGRRNVEGGGRQDDIGHQAYRIIGGVRGSIGDLWNYDAYVQHGTTERSSTYLNDFSIARTIRALQVRTDPETGEPACIAAIEGVDPGCVPWNIWTPGGVTPEALAYVQTPGLIRAEHVQQIAHFDITGDLTDWVRLPTADTGLGFNFGLEWRDEETEFNPDIAFSSGDLAGQGGATLPTTGGYYVWDAFLEARLPLVEGRPGAEVISLEAGYRYSDYSVGFETDTYKFGADWSPIDSLRLRTSYARAVRAPSVGELFSPQTVLLDGTNDPCDGTPDPGVTAEQCALTGLPPALFGTVPENPAAQYNGLLGGNPEVGPEKSDTISFGFIFQPEFVRNLSISVDYFDIEVEDAISSLVGGNADTYINQCIATGDPVFCERIHRDEFGSLWLSQQDGFIVDTSENIGFYAVTGIDMQTNYNVTIGGHRLGFNLVGTWMEKAETELVEGLGTFDCVGLYGGTCGVPTPEWRHSLRTTWRTPWAGLDLSLAWRYFDGVEVETTSSNPQLTGPVPLTDREFGSRSYLDLTAAARLFENYTLRIGVNNLFDKDPPLVGQDNCPAGECNGNTFAQVYDVLGRQWFATVTANF